MSVLTEQHSNWTDATNRMRRRAHVVVTCPACGQPIEGTAPKLALIHVRLTPNEARLVDLAVAAFPEPIKYWAMVEAVWPNEAERPAGDRRQQLAVTCVQINRKIRPIGWQITGAFERDVGSRVLSKCSPRELSGKQRQKPFVLVDAGTRTHSMGDRQPTGKAIQ